MKLTLRGRTLDLTIPVIMGILNVTPDSFSDGGKFSSLETAVEHAKTMISQGAQILDIGGESTRPGSDPVDVEVEFERTIPVIEAVRTFFPEVFISIDTTKKAIAEAALVAGADLVNDVSGLRKSPEIANICAKFDAGLVIMHSVGDPKTMQQNPRYEDVVEEVKKELLAKATFAATKGVRSIILDYGLGFGKTLDHNVALVTATKQFAELGFPLLVGASRKSMIGKMLENRPVEGRLAGSLAVHTFAVQNGAKILRVHDVQETADMVNILHQLDGF